MVETGLMGSRSESVRRWWEHRHALWDVSPGELVALQKADKLSESLKGYAVLAQDCATRQPLGEGRPKSLELGGQRPEWGCFAHAPAYWEWGGSEFKSALGGHT